jgi:hypothetical protein
VAQTITPSKFKTPPR